MELVNNNTNTNDFVKDVSKNAVINPIWITVVAIIITLSLYELWARNRRSYILIKNMPGIPMELPVIGHAHMVLNVSNAELLSLTFKYWKIMGATARARLGHVNYAFISDPRDIEILIGNSDHMEKSYEYLYFKPWFGDGLLISNGEHWRHHRKMIVPTFHQSILKSFVPTFAKQSQRVVQKFEHVVGKEIDAHHFMSETIVKILLSTAMGVKKLPQGNRCSEYAKAVMDMCDIIHQRQIKPIYRLDVLYKYTEMSKRGDNLLNTIMSLAKQVIADRRKDFNPETDGVLDEQQEQSAEVPKIGLRDDLDDFEESDVGAKRRLALLDGMVEMTKNPSIEWNEKDIEDEVNTLMFEGHDTTSAGSSFVLCLMGIHTHIQEKVFEEQQSIFADNLHRDCTFADTLEMHYLERVIKETLRLYPPVPIIARKTSKDVKLASGPYIIPEGTTVVVGNIFVHRSEQNYENASVFNPDNFLPENVSKRHYYSYIPFSAGPRSCVGRKFAMLMLKVLLSTIIRNYKIHCDMKEADLKLQGDIILKLVDGFKISVEKRI